MITCVVHVIVEKAEASVAEKKVSTFVVQCSRVTDRYRTKSTNMF